MIDTEVVPFIFMIVMGTCASLVVAVLIFYYIWEAALEKEGGIMKRVGDED